MRKSIEVDVALIDQYDALIIDLELTIVRNAKYHDADAFHRLRSVPGIGRILALTILYELHDITRFDRVQQCASYARLVKCRHESAGRVVGSGGAKIGNVHLKRAFSEAAVTFLRHNRAGQQLRARLEKKHGKGKALSILAHRIGRAVYYMLSRETVFSMEKCLAASRGEGGMSHTSKSSRFGPSPLQIAPDPCASSATRDRAPQVRQHACDDETPTLAPRRALPFEAAPCPSLEPTDAPTGDVARHEEAGRRVQLSF